METFVWTMFILYILGIILTLIQLVVEYGEKERLLSSIKLVIQAAFAIWAGILIF